MVSVGAGWGDVLRNGSAPILWQLGFAERRKVSGYAHGGRPKRTHAVKSCKGEGQGVSSEGMTIKDTEAMLGYRFPSQHPSLESQVCDRQSW